MLRWRVILVRWLICRFKLILLARRRLGLRGFGLMPREGIRRHAVHKPAQVGDEKRVLNIGKGGQGRNLRVCSWVSSGLRPSRSEVLRTDDVQKINNARIILVCPWILAIPLSRRGSLAASGRYAVPVKPPRKSCYASSTQHAPAARARRRRRRSQMFRSAGERICAGTQIGCFFR